MIQRVLILAQNSDAAANLSGGLEKAVEGQESIIYYAFCGIFFVLCGLACGYFIWRKGHMQMLDVELEVERTKKELEGVGGDLKLEERELRAGEHSRAS